MPRAEGSSRVTPRWLIAAAVALLAARVVLEAVAGKTPPVSRAGAPAPGAAVTSAPAPAELVRWRPIEAGLAEARERRKPVLYDFTAEWCPPCRMMAREVFADAGAARTIDSLFVPVRVLDRQREEGRNPPAVEALQRRYRIQAFPTLVVVPPEGGIPLTIEGYPGKESLLQRLAAAAAPARPLER